MTTALSTQHSPTGMSVYDQVTDPLAFIEKMGKVIAHSGAVGCKSVPEGELVALACLCERQSPFDIQRRYHLMDGKLSMRSEVMLAEFRRAGGKHRWVKDGSDNQQAELELTDPEGNSITTSYSVDDAKRAGIYRDNSGWTKNTANMLRARCCSNGVRMLMPEIVSGVYTPEENEDVRSQSAAPPKRTAEETASRREQLQQMQSGEAEAEVIDSTATTIKDEPVATEQPAEKPAEAEQVPFDTDEQKVGDTVYLQIDSLLKSIGMTREEMEEKLRQANPQFTKIDDLNESQAAKLVENLRSKLEASKK